MTVQWLEDEVGTVPLRAFRVAPHQAYPFEAGPFRVPPSEGPDTPYADECDTVGSGWLKQNVGQLAPYARAATRPYIQSVNEAIEAARSGRPRLRQAPRTPARRTTGPAQMGPTPGKVFKGYALRPQSPQGPARPVTGPTTYPGPHWTAGVGQAEEKKGTATTKEKDDHTVLKYGLAGVIGFAVGVVLFNI